MPRTTSWLLSVALVMLLTPSTFAGERKLHFIYPDGEGDSATAAPYIGELYAYVREKSGVPLTGAYYNDAGEALAELQTGAVDLAVVSPEFYAEHKSAAKLSVLLHTIPVYAERPYEKYYVLCGENMNPSHYASLNGTATLFTARAYKLEFIDTMVKDSLELRRIAFAQRQPANILTAMQAVGRRDDSSFILLTGYEHHVWKQLKSTMPDLAGLKVVYESAEMPSSVLVRVGDGFSDGDFAPIRKVLLDMPLDPRGKKILESLRLKGFAP